MLFACRSCSSAGFDEKQLFQFLGQARKTVSVVILPQGKAWVELEEMTAGSEWDVEVAQGGEAVQAKTEATAGMRGDVVSFRGEEKIEV